jgi:hypothetical protein
MTMIEDAIARYHFPMPADGDYLQALIAHVEARNFAAAHELRVGRRQAEWTAADRAAFEDRIRALPGQHRRG